MIRILTFLLSIASFLLFDSYAISGWLAKTGSQLSVAQTPQSIQWTTDFGKARFSWLAWAPETPLDLRDTDCLRFRIIAPNVPPSNHRLFVRLLTPNGSESTTIAVTDGTTLQPISIVSPSQVKYYDNHHQSILLDFSGSHEVVLDLAQFVTPHDDERNQSLSQIVRIELMVRVQDIPTSLSLTVTEPIPDNWTESELLIQKKITTQKNQLIATLRSELDSLTPPNPDTVQSAIQRWCYDDLERSLESDDLPTLQLAFQKLHEISPILINNHIAKDLILTENHIDNSTILTNSSNDQHSVLTDYRIDQKSILIKSLIDSKSISPKTQPTIDWNSNPFVRHPLRAIERDFGDPAKTTVAYPRTFPVGRAGFDAIREPWDFRRYAEESAVLAWLLTRPGSPLQSRPELVEPLLSRLQLLATQHIYGDYGAGRSSTRGYDPNGNRFALAAALEAWNRWTVAFANQLPTPWFQEIDHGFRQLVAAQIAEYGTGRIGQITGKSPEFLIDKELISIGYANIDAIYLRILDLAIRHWPNDNAQDRWRMERSIFQQILAASLLPDGGFRYLADENDSPLYHQVVVLHLAAIVRDRRSETPDAEIPEEEIIRKSLPYYPLTFEPSGIAEYTTSPSWKQYWNRGDAAAPAILAGLCNDPANQAVAENCAQIWGYGKGYYAVTAADFWKPITPQTVTSHRIVSDDNIGGLRGRSGRWSWVAGRRIPDSESTRESITTSIAAHSAQITYTIHADKESLNAEASITQTPFRIGVMESDLAKRPLPLGAMAQFEWVPDSGTSISQHWSFQEVTAIGMISITRDPSDDFKAIHGLIRFGFDHDLEAIGENCWRYGELELYIHSEDIAIRTEPKTLSVLAKNRDVGQSTELSIEPGDPTVSTFTFTIELRGVQYSSFNEL